MLSELEELFFLYKYPEGKKILSNLKDDWEFKKQILKEISKTTVFLAYQKNYYSENTAIIVKEFLTRVSNSNNYFEQLNINEIKKYQTYLISILKPTPKELELSRKMAFSIKKEEIDKDETIEQILEIITKTYENTKKENFEIQVKKYNPTETIKNNIFKN